MSQDVLCTFPGRHGDLLWALPTIRAIAEFYDQPIDLQICGEFDRLASIIEMQPYIQEVAADQSWGMSHGYRPPTIRASPNTIVHHLGYQRWPELPLPKETYLNAVASVGQELPPLRLDDPWIAWPHKVEWPLRFEIGWTDCHFELKFGITELLREYWDLDEVGIFPPGSRWISEGGYQAIDWEEAAQCIYGTRLLLTDCSALHVLAVAMGIPVVIVEPMVERHNPIFYPVGMDGPQVTVVRGLDGLPTFDARHTRETIQKLLGEGRQR